jgi:hypothetical protein
VKRKVLIAFVLGCVLLFSLAGGVYATPPGDNLPPPGSTFPDVWQVGYSEGEFMHWGPAVYYGEDVLVIYEATGRDFYIAKKHYYHYTTQGSAKVYDDPLHIEVIPGYWIWTLGPDSDLIDERPFSGVMKFKDPQHCNGWTWPPEVWPGWFEVPVEYFYVNWVIAGVYDFTATCKDGDWTVTTVAHTSPPTRGGYLPPP